jgi:hypothetical protein
LAGIRQVEVAPILVHMVRTPRRPGLPEHDQNRAGRAELLATSFDTLERNIRDQLGRTRHTPMQRSIKVIGPSWSCSTPKRHDEIASMRVSYARPLHPVKLTLSAAFLKGI